jgi:multiple sugar transport system substrate-binding protein
MIMNGSEQLASFGRRPRRWLPAALAMALLLSACSRDGDDREPEGVSATIKVMHWNEMSFNVEFGTLFYASHPHIDVEVAGTLSIQTSGGEDYNEKLDEFIRREKPDILMLTLDQYAKYAADGRLVSLESYVTRDKLDLEGLIPGMVDLLREKGGGELYGLAPNFTSQAIYYNKDLFDRFGIDYPTDRMSWEEVLQLAARFPGDDSDEDRIYGLYVGSSDLHNLARMIGQTLGLRVVNPADKRMSIDSESWVRVYETALNAVRSGTLYKPDSADLSDMVYETFLFQDPFIGGKVAMAISPSYLMLQIREAASVAPDKAVKNWDIVTVPVDPANPDLAHDISFQNIFAINAESTNRDAAWAFIRHIHGDEYARVKVKTFNGEFPVRTKYIRDEEGRNMAAFYALKPSGKDLYDDFADLPDDFRMRYSTIGSDEMQAVLNNEKTIKEALASMQTRLQAALDEALAGRSRGGNAAVEEGGAVMTGNGDSVETVTESVPAETKAGPAVEGAAE